MWIWGGGAGSGEEHVESSPKRMARELFDNFVSVVLQWRFIVGNGFFWGVSLQTSIFLCRYTPFLLLATARQYTFVAFLRSNGLTYATSDDSISLMQRAAANRGGFDLCSRMVSNTTKKDHHEEIRR